MHSLAAFKTVLADRGYTRRHLHAIGAFRGHPIDRPAALAATDSELAWHVLARLFFLNVPVPAEGLAHALAPCTLDDLRSRGLLIDEPGGMIRSHAAIVPVGDLLTFRDFEPGETGHHLRPDHVLGVGMATSMLSTLTVRFDAARMLDLGTGQGFHAMAAAGHCGRIIATDINPRALAFARWGIEANAIDNIDLRQGSLFEPVASEAPFDLIVSNPPFIISPRHNLVCLGGDSEGDDLVRRLVEAAPAHLADGGFACIACNWHHADADSWSHRTRHWLADAGCDAWLIRVREQTAAEYVDQWMAEAAISGPDGMAISREAWSQSLQRLGAAFVSLGVLVMRKRTSPRHWFRADSLALEDCTGDASEQILRIFDNQTLLAECDDKSDLAELAWGLTNHHELVQRRKGTGGGGWSVEQSRLRQTSGFAFEVELDSHAAELLSFLDGMTPSREIIAVMAKRMKADPEHAVKASGAFLSHLAELGYLELPRDA
jgi:2-polyprenyl-3-methyl-5-hydroxy-6-metoxy-1,4-benzoquinol methylase